MRTCRSARGARRHIRHPRRPLFLLTSAVNVLALGVAGLLLLLRPARQADAVALAGAPLVVAVVVLAAVWVSPRSLRRGPLSGWGADLLAGVERAKEPLKRPGWRLAVAFGYLLFDVAVLWATFAALGLHPPIAALVLGYLVGFLANLIPVPGGVGVLDAGLVAALVLHGIPAGTAAAAVLVYHAIASWVLRRRRLWIPAAHVPALQPRWHLRVGDDLHDHRLRVLGVLRQRREHGHRRPASRRRHWRRRLPGGGQGTTSDLLLEQWIHERHTPDGGDRRAVSRPTHDEPPTAR